MLATEQYDRGWGGPIAIFVAIAAWKIAIEAWQWWQAREKPDVADDVLDGDVVADEDGGEPRPARWWERALNRAGVWAREDREPLPSPTGGVGSDTDDPEVTVGSDPGVSNRVPVVVYRDDKPLLGPTADRLAALPGWVERELRAPGSKRKGHNEIVREGARIHGVSETTVKRAIANARQRNRR